MSLRLLYGYTGSGKSYVAMTEVVQHLYEGGVVGLNYRLTDYWAYIAALDHPAFKSGRATYQECVTSLYNRCYYIGRPGTVEELAEIGKTACVGYAATRRERKTLIVVDEAQLYLNTRNYKENTPWVQLCTQHRKMGLDVMLLAHHVSMIDNQIERLIAFVTRVSNLHEELRVPGTDIRFPWPFIWTRTRPRDSKRAAPRIVGPIRERIAALYDSYEVFAFDQLQSVITHQGLFNEGYCDTFNPPPRPPGRLSASAVAALTSAARRHFMPPPRPIPPRRRCPQEAYA
jgi:hypothetical protein